MCHRNVLKYICAFLRKLLQYQASNSLDAKFLGECTQRPLPTAHPRVIRQAKPDRAASRVETDIRPHVASLPLHHTHFLCNKISVPCHIACFQFEKAKACDFSFIWRCPFIPRRCSVKKNGRGGGGEYKDRALLSFCHWSV